MFKRILVPFDGSETSNKALVAALQLAREADGCVRIVHALDVVAYLTGFEYSGDVLAVARNYAQLTVDDALAIARAADIPADGRVIDASDRRLGELVAAEAADFAADLVVVGSHGRRGVGRVLLGSGAEQVVRMSPVPVLVVRGATGS